MRISSNFDSGNIRVIEAQDPLSIKLTINNDNQAEFYQWFHFKLDSIEFVRHKIFIQNLAKSSYPAGWQDYQVLASYDRDEWFRVDTEFDGDNLIIDFMPEYRQAWFAYFIPYSYERHLDLIARAQTEYGCSHELLGHTVDGRDMSLLQVGQPQDNKKVVWITARQHPGETMASWLMEGLLERLLDEEDGVARTLLDKAVFYLVPHMNPDGGVRGHLRTNAVGVNLNREWQNPSMAHSPEVYLVKDKMQHTGVDLFLDIHGDEAIPYNFAAGCEGNPGFSQRLASLEDQFKQALIATTPEFQDKHGYPKDLPGEANMTVASNAVGHAHDCLALTIEMPFKDNNDLPDPAYGWSVPRCKQLGEDLLVAIRAVVDKLRSE